MESSARHPRRRTGARPGGSDRPEPFSLVRAFVLADFITLANASAGMGAILLCLRHLAEGGNAAHVAGALGLLAIALVCDAADGVVARAQHRASPFGADLDSLADVVSFGVAPAVLGFTLGLDGLWDAVVLCAFVCCGASRLARFNVTWERLSHGTGKVEYYEGTPIPTSMLIVLVLAAAWWTGAVGDRIWLGSVTIGPATLHPLVALYALSGSAMMSARLRIPKP
jgi:CDP-diacylglycerol--serine O-phosphatidyltransferase